MAIVHGEKKKKKNVGNLSHLYALTSVCINICWALREVLKPEPLLTSAGPRGWC